MEQKFYTTSDDKKLCYYELGEGQPILMIPGWTFNALSFIKQIEYFSDNYRVIAVDPRSQGLSDKSYDGNDYHTHARDIHELISLLNLDDIILIGWSAGNLTAWNYLEQYNYDKIAKLITIDMSPVPLSCNDSDWVEGTLEDIADIHNNLLTNRTNHSAFINEYATEVMYDKVLDEDQLNKIINTSLQTPTLIARMLFASAMFSNSMSGAKLANDNIPSLMIIAEHWKDIAVPFTKKNLPNYQTAVLGGHMMFDEYSEDFNKIVEDFITE